MQENEYQLMRQVQAKHWWWIGRGELLRQLMTKYLHETMDKRLVADVGSGFGSNIPLLSEYVNVCALETDDNCLEYIRENYPECITIKWKSPEPCDCKFDILLLADVLEHIKDDKGAMQWISEHLKPGGLAFITVPAHMFFWTEMDDVVHHFRRYTKKSLLATLPPDLDIVKVSYYNAILFPVKAIFVVVTKVLRLFRSKKIKQSYNGLPPKIINKIFLNIMLIEAKVIKKINLFFGVSLIIVLKIK